MPTLGEIKQFFNDRAASWDTVCSHSPEKIAAVITLADIKPAARVLDIACGTGVLFPALLSCNPASVLGVDLSEEMIAQAAKKFDDPRVSLLAQDVYTLSQADCFDRAIIYSAYPHFPDKQSLALQLSRLLVSGGRFMIAHSESRDTINGRHHSPAAQSISVPLRAAKEEATVFESYFTLDILVDTSELYMISGVKKG